LHEKLLARGDDKRPFHLLDHLSPANAARQHGDRADDENDEADHQNDALRHFFSSPWPSLWPPFFWPPSPRIWVISMAQPIAVGMSPPSNQGPTPKVKSPRVSATPTSVTVIGEVLLTRPSSASPSSLKSGGTSPFSIIAMRS